MTDAYERFPGASPFQLISGLAAQDALGPVMQVMQSAFDPMYGEAWNQSQTRSMLTMPLTHTIIAEAIGAIAPEEAEEAAGEAIGFSMSRRVGDEEELLLIGVKPEWRHFGAGSSILAQVIENARAAGVVRLFLEMRSNNTATHLYHKFGFIQVGMRRNYYKGADSQLYDALTLAVTL